MNKISQREDMLAHAKEIATKAHEGQVDKAGRPYIGHPIWVSNYVQGETEKITAMLHDVVEDTPWTIEDLRKEGFSEEVLTAVDLLTRREGQVYLDYVRLAKTNPISKAVKLADLAHHFFRGDSLTDKHRERYEKAKVILESE